MSTFPTLTTEQAYRAMFVFLEAYWEEGRRTDENLAELLASMEEWHGETADRAMWSAWLKAVAAVTDWRLPDV
jgi:hypothetical protein